MENNNCEPFERLHAFLQDNEKNIGFHWTQDSNEPVFECIEDPYKEYFLSLEKQLDWIRDPF